MNFPTVIAIITVLFLAITISSFASVYAAEKKQLLIKDAIKNYSDYGTAETDYSDIYNPLRLVDGKTPSVNVTNTFWSQKDDSGFQFIFTNPLPLPVCSIVLDVFNPQNTPFVLEIGGKVFNGALDSTVKTINIDGCIKDVDKLAFNFDADGKWTTLAEMKLFTEEKVPPIEPPICPPNTYWDADLKKCVEVKNPPINGTIITNSTITLSVSDSNIVINADNSSEVKTNITKPEPQNKITLPKIIEEIPEEDQKDNDDKEDDN